jgi:hypothetical protein
MTSRHHPASYTGTYAKRYIHNQSDQAFIGPYAIDTLGRVHQKAPPHGYHATLGSPRFDGLFSEHGRVIVRNQRLYFKKQARVWRNL